MLGLRYCLTPWISFLLEVRQYFARYYTINCRRYVCLITCGLEMLLDSRIQRQLLRSLLACIETICEL